MVKCRSLESVHALEELFQELLDLLQGLILRVTPDCFLKSGEETETFLVSYIFLDRELTVVILDEVLD